MKQPLATIHESSHSTLDIYEVEDEHGIVGYMAERTSTKTGITQPQNNMTPEECIRYLAHIANGMADQAAM